MATAQSAPQKSTIVRTKTTAHRVLDVLAPALAEHLAVRQFFTPRRVTAAAALPLAGSFPVRSGSYRLRAWSWGEGPTVLLVHGWEGHAGQMRGFVEPLVGSGFRAVAVDLPAHGHSSGKQATVVDMARAIGAVAGVVGPVHGVIAHSMGASAAALALRPGHGLTASRAVLLAPPETPKHFVHSASAQMGLSPQRSARFADRVQRWVGVDLNDLSISRFAPTMTVPLLLMHDPADRLVPWAHGQAIAAAWPGARLRPTHRVGHRRILTDPAVIAKAVQFVSSEFSEEG